MICSRCGGNCAGDLKLWGWPGSVCWSCFQLGGRPMAERIWPLTMTVVVGTLAGG